MAEPIIIEFIGKDGVTKTARVVRGSLDDVGDAAERSSTNLRDVGDSAKDADNKFKAFNGTLEQLATVMVGVEAGKKVLDFAEEGAKISGVREAFTGLANAADADSKKLLSSLQAASKGYVDDVTLMKGANKALLSENEQLAQKLPQLLKISGAASKATGEDMGKLYSDLLEGITKAEPEILDNLGLTINLTNVYADYAKQLGKNANELTQAEKSQALLNEVLRQGDSYIQRVGGSAVETGASLQRLKTDWNNWMAARKEEAAMGLENILNGGRTVEQQTQMLSLDKGKEYEEYVAVLRMVGEEEKAVTRAQYEFEQSLIKTGVATTDAMARGDQYRFGLEQLNTSLKDIPGAAGVTAESLDAIQSAAIRAAEGGGVYRDSVGELIASFEDETITASELYVNLVALADAADRNTMVNDMVTDSTMQLADGLALVRQMSAEAEAGMYDLSAATEEQILKNINATIAAETLGVQQSVLTDWSYRVASGKISAGDASAWLSQQYGWEEAQVNRLIVAYVKMHEAQRSGKVLNIGAIVGGAGAKGAKAEVADIAREMRDVAKEIEREARGVGNKIERDARKTGRGGGGRGGTGAGAKSEAVKAAEKEEKELDRIHDRIEKEERDTRKKLVEIQRDYAQEVGKIHEEYLRKQAAATKEFQGNQFDSRKDFLTNVAGMERGDRNQAMAEYEAYWAESNKLAQEGYAEKADKLRKAGEEEILANTSREQAIRDKEKEIRDAATEDLRADLEEQKKLLEEADRIADDQATSRLNKIRADEDEIKAERDNALLEAETKFKEAGQALIEDIRDRNAEIQGAYADLQAAHNAAMIAMIESSQAVAAEMIALAGSVSGLGGSGSGGAAGGESPTAMWRGGVAAAGKPIIVGDDRGRMTPYTEAIVPNTSSYVLANDALRAAMNPPAPSGGGGITITGGITIPIPGTNQVVQPSPRNARELEQTIKKILREDANLSARIKKTGG